MVQVKSGKKRILLKLGSSTLTRGTQQISRGKLEDIARQCMHLKAEYDIIIVSSGAIAAAKQIILSNGSDSLKDKQALAAIGQPHLMRMYYEIFSDFNLLTSQCLLTYRDFQNQDSKSNIITTIESLLNFGYIPIINENDTTATEEIKFGDNDKLAALTASLLHVDLLIMATNTYGFYDQDPAHTQDYKTIERIYNVNNVRSMIGITKSELGSGGMLSKINAAAIAQKNGIETWLIYGYGENFILDTMNGKINFTKIIADKTKKTRF